MKSVARFLPWLLLLVALVCIGLDYRTISILRSENDGLKAALQAREAVESRQLHPAPPPATGAATPSPR